MLLSPVITAAFVLVHIHTHTQGALAPRGRVVVGAALGCGPGGACPQSHRAFGGGRGGRGSGPGQPAAEGVWHARACNSATHCASGNGMHLLAIWPPTVPQVMACTCLRFGHPLCLR